MDRNLTASVVIVAIVAAASVAILKDRDQDSLKPTTGTPTAHPAPAPESPSAISVLVPEQLRVPDASEDAALVAHVEHKYRHLIGEIDREYVDELKRRLLARETEASLPVRERMDSDIGELLPAEDVEYYQALKDSDLQQHRLAEYTGGLSNVAPLNERQERLVLEAKLRQKSRYAAAMRDAGLERDAMSAEERSRAHERAAEALKQSLDEFLMEVAPVLTPEQYKMLKNYESAEVARELSLLQRRIDAK